MQSCGRKNPLEPRQSALQPPLPSLPVPSRLPRIAPNGDHAGSNSAKFMAQSRELEGPPLGTRASGKIDFTVRRTSRSVFKPPPRSPLYLAFHSRCYCAYLSPSALCSSDLNRSARLFAPRSVDCPPSASRLFRHLCSARRRSCVRSGVRGATAFLSSRAPPLAAASDDPFLRRAASGRGKIIAHVVGGGRVDSPSPSFAAESQKTSCTTNRQRARRHYGAK